MESSTNRQTEKMLRAKKNHRRYLAVFLCLAAMVALGTVTALKMYGHAQNHTARLLRCTYRPHSHTQDCYDDDGELVCGLADYVVHQHNDDCFDKSGTLICQLPEVKAHTHGADCYEVTETLICGETESDGHQHSEDCYAFEQGDLVCELEEHTHTEDCYAAPEAAEEDGGEAGESVLTCGLEEHSHSSDCYEQFETLVCDQEESAGTQHIHTDACYETEEILSCGKLEMHTHTDSCYETDENGDQYLTCTEIVLEEHIHDDSCFETITLTDDEVDGRDVPVEGDALSSTAPEEEAAVPELPEYCYNEDGELICGLEEHIHTEECLGEDDEFDCGIVEHTHAALPGADAGDENASFEKTYQDSGVIITAVYGAEANIPAEAELVAYQVTAETAPDRYEQRMEEAHSAVGAEPEMGEGQMLIYNIGFFVDGKEIEPAAPVTITVQFLNEEGFAEGDAITIVHFGDEGAQTIDGTVTEDGAATFEADSFSDFAFYASNNAIATMALPVKYTAETVKFSDIRDNEDYVIFFYNTGYTNQGIPQMVFIGADAGEVVSMWRPGTRDTRQSYTPFEWTADQMSSSGNLIWKRQNGNLLLSQSKNTYLSVSSYYKTSDPVGLRSMKDENLPYITLYFESADNGRGVKIHSNHNSGSYLQYGQTSDGSWDWIATNDANAATTVYFAKAKVSTGNSEALKDEVDFPKAAITKAPDTSMNIFYNVYVDESGTMKGLKNVKYRILDQNGNPVQVNGQDLTITSKNGMEVKFPSLSQGTYYMVQYDVPDDFVINPEVWKLVVGNDGGVTMYETSEWGKTSENRKVGIIFNYKKGVVEGQKTAEYVQYSDRAYRVDITAISEALTYITEGINVTLVVDQSNSMLFPADLKGTGIKFQMKELGNAATLNGLSGLDKDELYYIVGDPTGTATVSAIWWNGETWLFQDAAYYYKAQTLTRRENNLTNDPPLIEGDHYVCYPKTGFGYSWADTRKYDGKAVEATGGGDFDVCIGSSMTAGETYELLTAVPDEDDGNIYTRLTYLEGSMAGLIKELALLNPTTSVSLVKFTSVVNESDCYHADLDQPNAVKELLNRVSKIETVGGTRQDKAIKHVNDSPWHQNHIVTGKKNYVVLITDGAPVRANGDNDSLETIRANLVRESRRLQNSGHILATIGLSVGNVKSGASLLAGVSTGGYDFLGTGANDKYTDAIERQYEAKYTERYGSGKDYEGDWFWNTENSSGLTNLLLGAFFKQMAVQIKLSPVTGVNIRDVISESFYIYDPDSKDSEGNLLYTPLKENDKITLEGHKAGWTGKDAAGVVGYDEKIGWYVDWLEQSVPAELKAGDYVDGYGNQITRGDDIDKDHKTTAGGKVVEDGSGLKIEWLKTENGHTQGQKTDVPGPWHGTIYLKAKEDFIGGNAIDTNAEAYITVDTQYHKGFQVVDEEKIELDIPNVNVRLLPMSQHSSEVTVFLGDQINGMPEKGKADEYILTPKDSLKYLYNLIEFKKVTNGTGTSRNHNTWSEDYIVDRQIENANCDGDSFDIQYSIERTMVENGEKNPASAYAVVINRLWDVIHGEGQNQTQDNTKTITVPYTYDEASSHGPVGEFVITITKADTFKEEEGKEHSKDHSKWDSHKAEEAGKHVETYTLDVDYRAYTLAERDKLNGETRKNEHNNEDGRITGHEDPYSHTHSPGTEVAPGHDELEDGKDTVESRNCHWVNVIGGRIHIEKTIDLGVASNGDSDFYFDVYKLNDDGTENGNDPVETIKVVVKNGYSVGSATLTDVPRGLYKIVENVEKSSNKNYSPEYPFTIIDDSNCYAEQKEDGSTIVHMGWFEGESGKPQDVISYHRNPSWKLECQEQSTRYGFCQADCTHMNPGVSNVFQYTHAKNNSCDILLRLHNAIRGAKINIKKVSMEENHSPLPGATFELYDDVPYVNGERNTDAELLWTGTSDAAGMLTPTDTFPELKLGRTYYLLETKAPDGYNKLDGAVKIAMSLNSSGGYVVRVTMPNSNEYKEFTLKEGEELITIEVPNSTGYELPSAGGAGTKPLYAAGILLMSLAVFLLYRKRSVKA